MDFSSWTDSTGTEINPFITAYRDALKAQRDSTVKQLKQQRRNDYASLMSAANRSGALYSNLPQRAKMQYDTGTYMPAYTKANTSYLTGLDTLRKNTVNLWNAVKEYQEQINHLNSVGL